MASTKTPPAGQQDPPAPPQQDPPAGDGSQATDARFERIEAEQREQRGILDKVLAAVTGGAGAAAGQGSPPAPGSGAGVDPASIAAQVRQEIADADQRRQTQAADKAWRDDVTETIAKVKEERQPREPQTGIKAKARRAMFGID